MVWGSLRCVDKRRVSRLYCSQTLKQALYARDAATIRLAHPELPQAVHSRFVRIVIVDTYPPPPAPNGRDFTPISEVVVEGMS